MPVNDLCYELDLKLLLSLQQVLCGLRKLQ
jgi:hypothetical protein